MQFSFRHTNLNVKDIDRSIAFYAEALGLEPKRVREAEDGSFKLAFLSDNETAYELELTWLRDHEGAYVLGDNETHICFSVDNYDAAYEKHKAMNCICFENKAMGLYFIEDPDGYWFEIVPEKR